MHPGFTTIDAAQNVFAELEAAADQIIGGESSLHLFKGFTYLVVSAFGG
jgi:hypothetical protein